ncbi:MAG: glycosyltransferase family 9 protein [Kiloniellales bacterium]
MGFGDEIMVTGQARVMQERDPRPVAVRGRDGGARWHGLWDGNPCLAHPRAVAAGLDVQWLDNYPGHRPYVDYGRSSERRWAYTDWRCTPGEIHFSAAERRWASPWRGRRFVVIEPHIKRQASSNKRWGLMRSQAVVDLVRGAGNGGPEFVQFAWSGGAALEGIRQVATPSFRHACAVLAHAGAYVGPEGGLHHAAAALGVKAVVIFGGMTSPANTGYDGHVNLYVDGPGSPCGWRVRCAHCDRAMAAIEPKAVACHVKGLVT